VKTADAGYKLRRTVVAAESFMIEIELRVIECLAQTMIVSVTQNRILIGT
jgi:hypothetical protein